MSVTAQPRPRPALPAVAHALAACGLLAASWAASAAPWQAPGLIDAGAGAPAALAPGADLTALLASLLPLAPGPALWAMSWFGVPLLFGATLLAGHRRPAICVLVALCACANPLALHACASGWGLAAGGAFVAVAQLVGLPERTHDRGLPLLGAGLVLAAASVPGSGALALPLFGVLWLAAPAPWRKGTMRAVYLTAFALPAAWFGTLAYFGWQSGAPAPAPIASGSTDGWHLALGAMLACACAPGLLAEGRARPAGLAVLGLSALAFTAEGVPDQLAVWIAWCGQAAACLRRGGPGQLALLAFGTLGSAGAAFLLA